MSNNPFPLSREALLHAYRTMRTIRLFEERLHCEFSWGELPGFVHLYAGAEACATGVMMHLNERDCIASTHRGHGHCIAKGIDVAQMMAELFGKAAGVCCGKGGSMHIMDLSKGMMGANGILGAGASLICGAGLAAKYRNDNSVGITFLGDSAANQGTVLESMNLAVDWNLPVIFVVENNIYAEPNSVHYASKVDSFSERATSFGMPGVFVDGRDFFAVHKVAGEMINRAREGGGPALLECHTSRFYTYCEGDTDDYTAWEENEKTRLDYDCLKIFSERVIRAGILNETELDQITNEIAVMVDAAANDAKEADDPKVSDLLRDVYVSY